MLSSLDADSHYPWCRHGIDVSALIFITQMRVWHTLLQEKGRIGGLVFFMIDCLSLKSDTRNKDNNFMCWWIMFCVLLYHITAAPLGLSCLCYPSSLWQMLLWKKVVWQAAVVPVVQQHQRHTQHNTSCLFIRPALWEPRYPSPSFLMKEKKNFLQKHKHFSLYPTGIEWKFWFDHSWPETWLTQTNQRYWSTYMQFTQEQVVWRSLTHLLLQYFTINQPCEYKNSGLLKIFLINRHHLNKGLIFWTGL